MPHWNADHILNLLSFQLTLTASAAPIQAWLGRPDVRQSLEQALNQSATLHRRRDAINTMQQWLRSQHAASFGSSGTIGAPGEVFAWEHLWGFLAPLLTREEDELPSHDDLMALQAPLNQSTDGLMGQDEVVPVPTFDQRQSATLLAPDQASHGGQAAASFQWQEGARQYSAWEGVLGGVDDQSAAVVPPSMAMFDEFVEKEDGLLSSLSMSTAASSSPLLDDAHVPSPPGLSTSPPSSFSPSKLAEAVTPPPPSISSASVNMPARPTSTDAMDIPEVPVPISPARSFPSASLSDISHKGADAGTQDFMDAVPLADPGSLFAPEDLISFGPSAQPKTPKPVGVAALPLPGLASPPSEPKAAPEPAVLSLSPQDAGPTQSEWELDAAFENAFPSEPGIDGAAAMPAPPVQASQAEDAALDQQGPALSPSDWTPSPTLATPGESERDILPVPPQSFGSDTPALSPLPALAPIAQTPEDASTNPQAKAPFDPFVGSLSFDFDDADEVEESPTASPVVASGPALAETSGHGPVALAPTLKPAAMSPSSVDLDVVVGSPVAVDEPPAAVAPPPPPVKRAVATATPKPPPRPAPLMLNKGLGSGVRQPIGGSEYIQRPGADGIRRQEERVGPEVLRVPTPQLRMEDSGFIVPNDELLAAIEDSPFSSNSSQFLRIALILLGVLGLLGVAFGLYLFLR